MKDDRRFYVYAIFRPDGSPCYIGKGSGKRWTAHDTRCHNPRLRRILERCKGNVIRVRVREHLTEMEAHATEMALIAAIGRSSRGPLVNMTDGGEGTAGYKRTAEEIAAISQRARNRVWTPEQREAARQRMKNFKHTEETKAKIGAAHRGKLVSKEQIARLRAMAGGRTLSPQHLEIVTANFRKPKSEEHKAKLRAQCIARNIKGLSDETKARMSAAKKGRPSKLKGRKLSEETKARIRATKAAQSAS